MRIRIINDKDWERSYELDKSIIRVGSQVTCDVLINDTDVPALMMQITRTGTIDIRNSMRFFAANIILTRGDQSFPAEMNLPYEVLDGDKISFSRYRMIIELDSDKSRVRQSEHMRAEMFLSDRDLSPERPISGGLLLKNLGTQRPCQFRMNIKGIPSECLYSSPLPYLHPGASSSVGFTISHLKTKPAPGFHTVSITLSAPDDYYGEMLEFNQDIYVRPVFDNVMILEDDTDRLETAQQKENAGGSGKLPNPQVVLPDIMVRDSGMMNMDESVLSTNTRQDPSVRVLGKDDTGAGRDFEEDDEDDEVLPGYRRKKERVVVIRGDDDKLFEGETKAEKPVVPGDSARESTETASENQAAADAAQPEGQGTPAGKELSPIGEEPALSDRTRPDAPAGPQPEKTKASGKKKKSKPENEIPAEEPQAFPRPAKKPVKFKPEVVLHADGKDAFDQAYSESDTDAAKLSPDAPSAAEPASTSLPDAATESASAPEAEALPAKKPRKKKTEKENETTAEPAEDVNLLVLGAEQEVEETAGKPESDASAAAEKKEKSRKKNSEPAEPAVTEAAPEPAEPSAETTQPEEAVTGTEEQSEAEGAEPAVTESVPEPAEPSAETVQPEKGVVLVEEQPKAEMTEAVMTEAEAAPEPVEPSAETVLPEEAVPAAEEQPAEPVVPETKAASEPDTFPAETEKPEEPTPTHELPEAEPVVPVVTETQQPAAEPLPEKKPPVPVFAGSAGFDDFESDVAADAQSTQAENSEPAVRVMKGGSFD